MPEFRRLDRLQVGPDEVLVIDFKTGQEKSDEYNSQMQEYMAAVAPAFPGQKMPRLSPLHRPGRGRGGPMLELIGLQEDLVDRTCAAGAGKPRRQ